MRELQRTRVVILSMETLSRTIAADIYSAPTTSQAWFQACYMYELIHSSQHHSGVGAAMISICRYRN